MWKNKHLAAIPKARVDETGQEIVEVGAHHKGIVEELEKAHIYIEQLHENNKALEEKIAKLDELKAENEQLRETLTARGSRLNALETMMLALSTNPNEKLVKLNQLNLDEVQKTIH